MNSTAIALHLQDTLLSPMLLSHALTASTDSAVAAAAAVVQRLEYINHSPSEAVRSSM
jgi:hypothetical protein